MGRASGSKPETRIRKVGIEYRHPYLRDGLLNHPVHDGRDTQQPCASPRFGNRHSPHWLWLVEAIGQLLADLGPVRTCKLREILDAHPVNAGRAAIGLHPLPCPSQVRGVQNSPHQIIVQGWLRVATPAIGSPGRAHRRCRVGHGSPLSSRVWPFTVQLPSLVRLLGPLLTSARSRPALPRTALSNTDGRVRWLSHGFRRGPQAGSRSLSRPQAGQISPNKNMNFLRTTAAFTLSPVPGGFRHHVLTHPETGPSMRCLFVGSHVCARASFRPALTDLPLPSASSYSDPKDGHYRYSYRGPSPHQFMPMSGVHSACSRRALRARG